MIIGKKKETPDKGALLIFQGVSLETVAGREDGQQNLRITQGMASVTIWDMPKEWPAGATATDVDVYCSVYARSKGGYAPDKVLKIMQDGSQVWPESKK